MLHRKCGADRTVGTRHGTDRSLPIRLERHRLMKPDDIQLLAYVDGKLPCPSVPRSTRRCGPRPRWPARSRCCAPRRCPTAMPSPPRPCRRCRRASRTSSSSSRGSTPRHPPSRPRPAPTTRPSPGTAPAPRRRARACAWHRPGSRSPSWPAPSCAAASCSSRRAPSASTRRSARARPRAPGSPRQLAINSSIRATRWPR